ncbi:hypothetical protein OHA72_10110 [Dactylosporangium sp. NBC_01737]|nr:hypothetical protein OHA72_10110 [Dactylosporangium sp. NBC_01737]
MQQGVVFAVAAGGVVGLVDDQDVGGHTGAVQGLTEVPGRVVRRDDESPAGRRGE